VRDLCTRLRGDGFEPWLDEEQLLPGQDWEFEISQAVKTCDVVIVCLSEASVAKTGYVQKELRHVLNAAEYRPEGHVFVVPVRLEPCVLPNRLTRWQRADLFAAGGYDRLCAALRGSGFAGKPVLLDEAEPGRRLGKQWGTGIAITCATILVAGGIGIATYFRVPDAHRATTATGPADTTDKAPPGMVRIPGGRFLMGRNGSADSAAAPAHEVTLPPFDLDILPVTNAQFQGFHRSTEGAKVSADWPATRVSWDEAESYCLAQQKRLPTEAEWEFAARGTDGRLYPWGEAFKPDAVNYEGSGLGLPEPAGSRNSNRSPFGVLDMSGNVWQWCSDEYKPYPGGASVFPIPKGAKVIRGGSFQSDFPHVSSVTRNLELPSRQSPAIGFRCAK